MKNILISSFLLAVPTFAGTSQVTPESAQANYTQQDTWSWFIGGTGGYLFDLEEDMYTLQIGAKSPWSVAGWSVALFGEGGWTESHEIADLSGSADTDIIPITFNVKLERLITGGLSAYVGGGAGVSYVDTEINASFAGDDRSTNDWVFSAQAFAGLAYHVQPNLEVFAGTRWLYFDDPDFRGVSLGSDWMVEGGVRFHF